MAQQKITMTKAAIVGGAGLLAWQFLYKPWKAAQDAAATPLPFWGGGGGGGGGSGLPYVTTPSTITPSNLNPGAAVGGPVGACMQKKGWTQQQCTDRLNQLVSAYQGAVAQLNLLKSGQGGADVLAQLAATRNALQGAMAQYNAAMAAGDAAGANQWKLAIDGHNADIRDLEARGSSQQVAAIAKWETAIAGHKSNYLALTGYQIA